jgi:hypothetical protein
MRDQTYSCRSLSPWAQDFSMRILCKLWDSLDIFIACCYILVLKLTVGSKLWGGTDAFRVAWLRGSIHRSRNCVELQWSELKRDRVLMNRYSSLLAWSFNGRLFYLILHLKLDLQLVIPDSCLVWPLHTFVGMIQLWLRVSDINLGSLNVLDMLSRNNATECSWNSSKNMNAWNHLRL